jgi:hypothetical protein
MMLPLGKATEVYEVGIDDLVVKELARRQSTDGPAGQRALPSCVL